MACKTGIITFQNANNYGAVLQAFALQTVLSNMGHEISIINYDSPSMGLKKCQSAYFKEFIDRYLILTDSYSKGEDINSDEYDLLIAGSDQIWNTQITEYDETYFLDFKKDHTIGASYAASIGLIGNDLESSRDFFGANLHRFDHISLRESIQSDFISEISGKNVSVNIDPTLLLDVEQYKEFLGVKQDTGKYIFMYSNNTDAKMLDFVNLLSLHTGMPIMAVTMMESMLFTEGSWIYRQIPVVEWIEAIASSTIVITDSFHGLMFSIIFEKPFYVYTKKRANISRINDMLGRCGLTDRRLVNISSMTDVDYDVDYTQAKEVIKKARDEAYTYLRGLI